MSDVPPDQPTSGGGWQPSSGGYPPPGGAQPPPPPAYQAQYGYQQQPAGPMGPAGQTLAEWWKRLVAFIVDALILGIPLGILYVALIAGAISQTEFDPVTGEIEEGGGLFSGAFFGFQALSFLVNLAYYGLLNGSDRGQTVGKMLLRIRVRDANSGGPIGIGRGFGRSAVQSLLSFFTCGLGGLLDGLWPLWDPRRQALHDKAVSSVVVDAP